MTDPLDTLLDAYRTDDPPASLRAAIVAAAPRQRRIGRARRWLTGVGLGLGLAASAAAGIAAGALLAPDGMTRLIGAPATSPAVDVSALADPAGDAASG